MFSGPSAPHFQRRDRSWLEPSRSLEVDVLVFGGRDLSGRYQSSAFRYRAASGRWESLPPLPTAGGCGTATTLKAAVFIWIGCDSLGAPLDACSGSIRPMRGILS
ncbi:MAG: kelch repeat-containing protein [Gemmatimonadaceae bacterium]